MLPIDARRAWIQAEWHRLWHRGCLAFVRLAYACSAAGRQAYRSAAVMQSAAPAVFMPGGRQLEVQAQHLAGAVFALFLSCRWFACMRVCRQHHHLANCWQNGTLHPSSHCPHCTQTGHRCPGPGLQAGRQELCKHVRRSACRSSVLWWPCTSADRVGDVSGRRRSKGCCIVCCTATSKGIHANPHILLTGCLWH